MRRLLIVKVLGWLLLLMMGGAAGGAGIEQVLPVFEDVTEEVGLQFKHRYGGFDLSNIVEGTGSGAVFFDYDGDGWLDIYFVNGCWLKEDNDNRGRKLRGKLKNSLYRNNLHGFISCRFFCQGQ